MSTGCQTLHFGWLHLSPTTFIIMATNEKKPSNSKRLSSLQKTILTIEGSIKLQKKAIEKLKQIDFALKVKP